MVVEISLSTNKCKLLNYWYDHHFCLSVKPMRLMNICKISVKLKTMGTVRYLKYEAYRPLEVAILK